MADTPGRKFADMLKNSNQGDVWYDNGTNIVQLTPGTAGYFLQTQGAGANPAWDQIYQWHYVGNAATTSGDDIEITGVPAGTTGLRAVGERVSCSGTNTLRLQFGDGSGWFSASDGLTSGAGWSSGLIVINHTSIAASSWFFYTELWQIQGTADWVGDVAATDGGTQSNGIGFFTDDGADVTRGRLSTNSSDTFDNGSWSLYAYAPIT